jgi:DNA repair exonuclease SbcCD ATPase subunit
MATNTYVKLAKSLAKDPKYQGYELVGESDAQMPGPHEGLTGGVEPDDYTVSFKSKASVTLFVREEGEIKMDIGIEPNITAFLCFRISETLVRHMKSIAYHPAGLYALAVKFHGRFRQITGSLGKGVVNIIWDLEGFSQERIKPKKIAIAMIDQILNHADKTDRKLKKRAQKIAKRAEKTDRLFQQLKKEGKMLKEVAKKLSKSGETLQEKIKQLKEAAKKLSKSGETLQKTIKQLKEAVKKAQTLDLTV